MFAVSGEVLGAAGIIAAALVALVGTIAATRSSARTEERKSLDGKLNDLLHAQAEDRAYTSGQLSELRTAHTELRAAHQECLDRESTLREEVQALAARLLRIENER